MPWSWGEGLALQGPALLYALGRVVAVRLAPASCWAMPGGSTQTHQRKVSSWTVNVAVVEGGGDGEACSHTCPAYLPLLGKPLSILNLSPGVSKRP